MTRWLAVCLTSGLLLLAAGGRASAAGPAPERRVSPGEYRAQLVALREAVARRDGAAALLERAPASWSVEDGAARFSVPFQPVRNLLASSVDGYAEQTSKALDAALVRMIADIDEYQAAPREFSRERARAARILSRPEFRGVRGPGWWDRIRDRVGELLYSLVTRLLGSSSFPVVARAVVIGLVALALIALAFWVYRTLRAGERVILVPSVVPVSAKEWTRWLADAVTAADAGDWAGAVHCAYWAGISSLEMQRLWPPDRARTPREYLRLLPAESEHAPTLVALTRTFEPVWYGRQSADAQTFSHALSSLEKLGCR